MHTTKIKGEKVREPIVVIMAGTTCWGKSTLLAECSSRFNICNIVQTKLILDALEIVMEDDFNKIVSDMNTVHLTDI